MHVLQHHMDLHQNMLCIIWQVIAKVELYMLHANIKNMGGPGDKAILYISLLHIKGTQNFVLKTY